MVQERDKKKSFCVFSRCLRLKKQQKTQKNAKKRFVFFVSSVDNNKKKFVVET